LEILLAVVIGSLYAAGLYMMMRRSIVKIIIGLVLLGHAANLLIFTASGLVRARAPLVPEGELVPTAPFADPLPQALILTAIVIGFGVIAFTVVLIHRVYQSFGTDDLEKIGQADLS
jgi:multicomponent Na+:H+ antiporter subunit C